MANYNIYNVIDDFTSSKTPDGVQTTPFWVICVFPLAIPLSFSRQSMASVKVNAGDNVRLRNNKKIIISSDCKSLVVNHSKDNHVGSLQAQLKYTTNNYLSSVLPGDWIMAWIVNSEEKGHDIIDRLNNNQAVNDFDDGLKFIGRVQSVNEDISRSETAFTREFQLEAYSFRELDSQLYYNIYLATTTQQGQAGIASWLASIGLDINDLFHQAAKDGFNDNVHVLIPSLIEIFLGKGVSKNLNPVTGLEAGFGPLSGGEKAAPYAYIIPVEIGTTLGRQSRDASLDGGVMGFIDICQILFGAQDYSNTIQNKWDVFQPKIQSSGLTTTGSLSRSSSSITQTYKYTGTPMMGAYIPLLAQFTNKPLWTILNEYLNPTCNEMYTTLRANENGKIVPHIVIRQIPFTTPVYAQSFFDSQEDSGAQIQNGKPYNVTEFLKLPRWKLHPVLIKKISQRRSDTTKFNFVQLSGQLATVSNNISPSEQAALNPPVVDSLDIQRSGIRPFVATIACYAKNQVAKAPTAMMSLVADMVIGNQYTLNGTFMVRGIQAPIAVGDNIEFDDQAYHIEILTHQCSIEPDGRRNFSTILQVTNGMNINGTLDNQSDQTTNEDQNEEVIYPGFESDKVTYSPGIASDNKSTGNED